MGRIGRGWQLAKMSIRVVRKDKEILLFPLLSGIITILILASFFIGVFFTSGFGNANSWTFYVFFFVFYFVTFFISIFFNAAVIGCATIRMNGGDPVFSDGIKTAMDNIKQILFWALFAATIGLILRAIQEKVGFIGKIVVGALGAAFTIATYFVVPVLIYEKLGPWGSLKRSVSILKNTWGEALVGNLGLGIVFFLLGLLGLVPIIVGVLFMSLWPVVIGIVIAVVYWLILGLVFSAAQSVLVAALYRYATTGKVSEDFAGLSFENPWATPFKRI
jgi:hypothetical protein